MMSPTRTPNRHLGDQQGATASDSGAFQRELGLQLSYAHSALTYQVAAHAGIVVLAVVTAIALPRTSALILAGPSLLILLATAFEWSLPKPDVSATVDRPRALEGDLVYVSVTVGVDKPAAIVDVELFPPRDIDRPESLRKVVSIGAGETGTVSFPILVTTWGVNQLGHITVTIKDRFGTQSQISRFRITSALRVHVREEKVGSLTNPPRYRRLVGSHLSPDRSDGCEIADIRPYQPGDRLRSLNWRISARNAEPWITLRHPDRSTTVVVVVDAFSLIGRSRQDALRRSVRGALGLARLHLGAQDPVGLLILGHGIRWFPPNLGHRHLALMTDGLLDLSTSTWADGTIGRQHIERLMPPEAVVVAVSPLLSDTFLASLRQLRELGHPVNVIEPHTNWPDHHPSPKRSEPNMAWRIFQLQRQVVRNRLSEIGCNVVAWEQNDPFGVPLMALDFRGQNRGRS